MFKINQTNVKIAKQIKIYFKLLLSYLIKVLTFSQKFAKLYSKFYKIFITFQFYLKISKNSSNFLLSFSKFS